MIFREAKARFQSQRKPTTNRFPLCKNGANSGCWDGKGGGNSGIVEGRLCIVTRLGLNWRIEYFFPVILRRFPVIEIFFPVNVFSVFDHKCPWMLGFWDFHRQFSYIFAFFPVFYPVIGILPSETGSYLTAHTTIQSPQTDHFRYDAK